jgi:hypothetical protein
MRIVHDYKQQTDNRWYAGEVKPAILEVINPATPDLNAAIATVNAKTGMTAIQAAILNPFVRKGKEKAIFAAETFTAGDFTAGERAGYVATDTSDGVCFALSVWWIIKNANGEDFWAWMQGPGEQVKQIKELFRGQKGSIYDFYRFEVLKKKIEAETKLRQKSDLLMVLGGQLSGPGYYYISICNEKGGHGVAIYLSPNKPCRYFDPNEGESEDDSMNDFLPALGCRLNYYSSIIKNHKIYHCRYA